MIQGNTKGFFLIEVVIAVAVITVVLVSMLGIIQDTVEVSQRSLERTQGAYLLEEGFEAVKMIRDTSWSTIANLSNGTAYYLSWNGTTWSLSTTPSQIGVFSRLIVFDSVSRDGNDDIVDSGGTTDTRTRKGTATVNWTTASGNRSEQLMFYIADIRN
jgi:Tfp pilus assembly protein PilV